VPSKVPGGFREAALVDVKERSVPGTGPDHRANIYESSFHKQPMDFAPRSAGTKTWSKEMGER
jgi:hypothetical protein